MTARLIRPIKLVIVVGMLASFLHFADNTVAIDQYPEPSWITPFGVVTTWFVITGVGLIALLRKRADTIFFVLVGLYSLVLMSGLLHYVYAAPMRMAARSNGTVLLEAVTGIALAGVLVAHSLRLWVAPRTS